MKYAVGLRRHDIIPSFIKIGSGIQKLLGDTYIDTHKDSKVVSYVYFYFFKNNERMLILLFVHYKESRLKRYEGFVTE
jgi:hypothetical protein